MKTSSLPLTCRSALTLLFLMLAPGLGAAEAATGTIAGRVMNPRTGEYIEGARLTVAGTTLEAFTDSGGSYRLTLVPAGAAQVTAFYTGVTPQTLRVEVAGGRTATLDFSLGTGAARADGSVVKLDAFRVETSREMDASALAINEQRFSSNIKNVLSTEEFGNVSEGNVAEFLKFLPGVTIDYT